MTKKYNEARTKLIYACEGYIKHNQQELDGVKATSFRHSDWHWFNEILGTYEPSPGFRDWICCQYNDLLYSIFFL